MTQQTIDRMQPLADEYTVCEIKKQMIIKNIKDKNREMSLGEQQQIKELIILQSDIEKEIMQILFDDNKEQVQQKITI